MAITLICAAKRGTTTPGPNAQTTPVQKIISTATTDGARTHLVKTEVGTMADGVIGIVTIIMKMEKEIATVSAIITAIDIPEAGTESLAEVVAERCQARKRGASTAPLGHPLLDLIKLGTPSAGVLDGR